MTGAVIRGQIDRAGHLVAADAALLRLHERAGGVLGGPLLLPQLVRHAAEAAASAAPVERQILAGDDDRVVAALVRFLPGPDGVALEIHDWHYRAPLAPPALPDAAMAPLDQGWRWVVDARLRLVGLWSAPDQRVAEGAWQGRSLSELFELLPGDDGQFPLLTALASPQAFTDQRARPAASIDAARVLVVLAGQPQHGRQGQLTGFSGVAIPHVGTADGGDGDGEGEDGASARVPAITDPAFGALPLSDPRFGRRIDGALRGPLSRIIASAETISGQFDGPIRADYARYAGDIAHAARHLIGLIDDLSDLQNIERPGFTAAREKVDLVDVARRASGLLMMKAEEKGIRMTLPPADAANLATGEFRRVLQVLINLIGNAIRYSPDGSAITITSHREGGLASISVADEGPGLSAEQQAVVFEKFERLGRTDSGGSGLGLYIARRLARAMDGDLAIESAPDHGACFTLTLPARG